MAINEKKPLFVRIAGERQPNLLPVTASAVGFDFNRDRFVFYHTASDDWTDISPDGVEFVGSVYADNFFSVGVVTASLGFSGSLTQLADGTSYLIAGAGIDIASASNGPITISSLAMMQPEYWFSTGSNEIYTTGTVLVRAGLSAAPTPSLIEFDVSGSSLQLYDGYGGFVEYSAGSFIRVKDVPVADPNWSSASGTLVINASSVYASGSGCGIDIIGGSGGWDDAYAQFGGEVFIAGGTGGSTVGLPAAGAGGGVTLLAGSPGWSGGSLFAGEEGKAGNINLAPGAITPISRSLSGSDLYVGAGGSQGFRYIGFDDENIYHITYEQDTYFFVSGTIGAKGTSNRAVAVFGGDLVVSGAAYIEQALNAQGSLTTTGVATFLDSAIFSGSVILGDSSADSIQITGSLDAANSAIFRSGLSGSLTQLADGTSYLIAGNGIEITSASNGPVTISKNLRDLITFIDQGPACGFPSGYKEQGPAGPFPTQSVWYTDASKTNKIVELIVTWSGPVPSSNTWLAYEADGTTVNCTVVDTFTYVNSIFEETRTRVIT